jgi:predicted permease
MGQNLQAVLPTVIEVFGLVAIAYLYARRVRFDAAPATRIGMDLLLPCLVFSAIMESRVDVREFGTVAAATLIQIAAGLLIGWIVLRLLGWQMRRELLMPIAFVNSANIPFPLLLANFGTEGLSRGVLCNMVTNLVIFTVGILLLHGAGRQRDALRQPALWATVLAALLRLLHIAPPDMIMRIPRLAGMAAIPLLLVLFGHALAEARLTAVRTAAVATLVRYLSGGVGLALTLWLLRPTGLLRQVLILYALLPSAMINVMLTQRAGRDARAVAAAVVLTTLVAVLLLPLILAYGR